ncbi:MAG: BON domain-containing protein [Planctomycetota bacterium]
MPPTATAAPAPTDALADRVHTALESSPHLSVRSMRIEAEHGHIRLAGDVGSFFEKQIAQEVVRRVDGVDRVENLLQVNWL